MNSSDFREQGVLIVGGGIAGLALGGALQRLGVRCEIAERCETWQPVGAGIILGVNAMAVMRVLGLAESLEKGARRLEEMKIADTRNRCLTRTNLKNLEPRFGVSLAMHRAVLHDTLLESAGGVPVRMGTTVENASPRGDQMEVRFSDGTEACFGLIVGADGLHSRVRELAFGARALRYSGYTCWRMVIDAGHPETPAQEMWGVGKRFGLVPLDGNRVYCFAVINERAGQPDPEAGRVERLREHFAEFGGPVPGLLERIGGAGDLIKNDLHEIIQRPFFRGRWVLVGDAAHGMLPDMGQGAAMALEDVVVLVEGIASGLPLVEVLAGWAKRREGRVRKVQYLSRRIGRVGQWENRLACRIRNEMTRLLPDAMASHLLVRLAGQPI
jgi:2-polyprenyl-6-methoxyphenol hydroxylase-like FAD-dependent oxidoreductase